MDQPKPSSISPLNTPSINEKLCPSFPNIIINLIRSQLLQNTSHQQSNKESNSNSGSQKQTQKISLSSSIDSSAASSPLSPTMKPADSSFSLSTKQFLSQQLPSSLSALNFGSLVNFNLNLKTNPGLLCSNLYNPNKRPKSNSQSKSNSSNKNHGSNLKSSPNSNSEVEKTISTIKTKKKKIAFKFDNRKYVRRSFTPMCELLQPVKVPLLDSDGNSKERSDSFSILDDETQININNFNQVKSHQILELYEARIQMGYDDLHLHPALAIKAADENSSTVFTKDEVKRFDNYEEINVYQPRPKFWPSRVWDNPQIYQGEQNNDESHTEDKNFSNKPPELTEQQSDNLLKLIEDSYKIPEIEVTYVSKSSKTSKKKRPHRSLSSSSSASRLNGIKNLRNQKSLANITPTVINLYAINVITDDSDLDTDLEDF